MKCTDLVQLTLPIGCEMQTKKAAELIESSGLAVDLLAGLLGYHRSAEKPRHTAQRRSRQGLRIDQ